MLDEKAHDNGVTPYRNLYVDGHNLETTPGKFNGQVVDHAYLAPYTSEQFRVFQDISHAAKHGKKKSVEAFHLIVSFDDKEFPLSGDQQQEAKQAAQLVHGFMDQQFPEDSQWLLAIQRDGKGHKLHAHVAINSVQTDGKVIDRSYTHQKDWTYTKSGKTIHEKGIASNLDAYLTANFERVTGRPFTPVVPSKVNRVHSAEEQIIRRGGYDWHLDLKNRITAAVKDPNVHSLSDFEAACAKQGVTVIRKRRGTGKKHKDGTKIYRVGYTYEFVGKDTYKSGNRKGQQRVHKMRDYRMDDSGHPISKGSLGTAFTPVMIAKEISAHELITQESDRRIKQAGLSESVSQVEHDEAGSTEKVATDRSTIQSRNEEENEDNGPRIHTAGEESKSAVEPEPDSSYSQSRSRQAFTAIHRLKYVDWSVFDPDSEVNRRNKRKQQKRERRLAEFQKRARAIAEHDRQLAANAGADRIRDGINRNWFKDALAKSWHNLLTYDFLGELKRIFGLDTAKRRTGRVRGQFDRNPQTPPRRDGSISQHTIDDGPDLF